LFFAFSLLPYSILITNLFKSTAQIWVQFDSGSKIALLEGIDSFEIITEE